MASFQEHDYARLRRAIELAYEAWERGNRPFGAVLTDQTGKVLLEAQNTVETDRNLTGHAETNLLREAFRRYEAGILAEATLYTSGEPCAMCAGATFWSGVGRLVYSISSARLYELLHSNEEHSALRISCRDVLASGSRKVEVIGPVLENEAERVFEGFDR